MRKALLTFVLVLSAACVLAQDIAGNYAIKNFKTGMLLRIKDANSKNGTPIVSYNPENWKCMTWNFKKADENTYQLQNLFSSKTLQPVSTADANVTLEEQPLIAGDARQLYEFIAVKKDTYLIRLKGTELYITPANAQGSVNSPIILAAKRSTNEQLWLIYQQAPTM